MTWRDEFKIFRENLKLDSTITSIEQEECEFFWMCSKLDKYEMELYKYDNIRWIIWENKRYNI